MGQCLLIFQGLFHKEGNANFSNYLFEGVGECSFKGLRFQNVQGTTYVYSRGYIYSRLYSKALQPASLQYKNKHFRHDIQVIFNLGLSQFCLNGAAVTDAVYMVVLQSGKQKSQVSQGMAFIWLLKILASQGSQSLALLVSFIGKYQGMQRSFSFILKK